MKKLSRLFGFKLRGRLILTTLAVALSSILIVATGLLLNARGQATDNAVSAMAHSLQMRKHGLEAYLAQVRGDLNYLVADPATADALYTLTASFERLDPDSLQSAYITDNPFPVGEKHQLLRPTTSPDEARGYHAAHARVHQGMRAFLEERGYYDIFLISTKGDIVYSVFKELDYATNLRNGAYASSGLADVWRAATDARAGTISFEDFRPYAPSYGAPASFLSIPVIGAAGTPDAGELLGVLAVQIPIVRLGEAIAATRGDVAEDAFLIGPDNLLRTDSRLTEVDDVLVTAIDGVPSAGQTALDEADLAQRPALVSTVAVDAFGTPWRIVETRTTESAFAAFERQKIITLLSLFPVSLLAVLMSWLTARSIVRPVQVLRAAVQDLADGKRTDIPTRDRADELGDLSRTMLQLNEAATATYRSEAALRASDSPTVICDENFQIVFANKALERVLRNSEAYWREHVPGFSVEGIVGKSIDVFHKEANRQRNMMATMHGSHRAEIRMDGQVAGLKVNPINDDRGRIGYLLQWEDLTAKRAAETAIEDAINAASAGNFGDRVHLESTDPFFIKLEDGLNAFFEEVETFLADLDHTLADFASGKLRVHLDGSYSGQLGRIADRVSETGAELAAVISKVKTVGDSIRDTSHEISEDANNLAQRTESQSASIEQTAASMEEISTTVKENAENSASADARAAEATQLAERGREVVASTVAAMAAIRESAGRISEVTSIIESLAFETHLLSLNASVEAARAGDAGKGFGVVAAEVGSLARRSTDEAKAIKKLITTSEAQVAEGDRLVGETDLALAEIIESVRTAADMITQIADASASQSKAIDEIAIAVAEMDNVTQQNSQLAEKSSVGAAVLTDQAEQMMDAVAMFDTAEGGLLEARQDAAWSSARRSPPAMRA